MQICMELVCYVGYKSPNCAVALNAFVLNPLSAGGCPVPGLASPQSTGACAQPGNSGLPKYIMFGQNFRLDNEHIRTLMFNKIISQKNLNFKQMDFQFIPSLF
jgi:hypothetical protein